MNLKICSKCGLRKAFTDFYLRKTGIRKGQLYEKCIQCMKERGRKYYHLNHDRQLKLALLRRKKAYLLKRAFINKFKDQPCADCGIKYPPYVMDLDHKDWKTKIKDVGYMTSRNWSLNKIKNEAQKCDIVCANCHRIRTYSKFAGIAKVVTAEL